jgi:hypothetical protein
MLRVGKFLEVKRMLCVMTFLLIIPSVSHGASTTYYVNGGIGSDTANSCSNSSSPCKSISHAVSVVPAGTSANPNIISVASGAYGPSDTGETFPIAITRSNIILRGSASPTYIDSDGTQSNIIVIEGSGVTVESFRMRDIPTRAIYITNRGVTVQNITFEDTVYHGVWVAVSRANQNSNLALGSINIKNNNFIRTTLGVLVFEDYNFDSSVSGITANIGSLNITGNTFTGLSVSAVKINEISVEGVGSGNVTYGNFVVSNNIFTDCENSIALNNIFIKSITGGSNVTFGNFNIEGNVINSSSGTFTSEEGIVISDLFLISDIYDNSIIRTGNVNITDNKVKSFENPLKIAFGGIYNLGLENGSDSVRVTRGNKTISRNTTTTVEGDGALLDFSNIGKDVYADSSITINPLSMDDNTFMGVSEALKIYFDSVGYAVNNTASVAFSPFSFDNNKLISEYPTHAVFLAEYETGTVGQNIERSGRVTLPDWQLSNNTIDILGNGDGFQLRSKENPATLSGNGQVNFGGVAADSNIINSTQSASMQNGIQVYLNTFGINLANSSVASLGNISATDNVITSVDNSGIRLNISNVGSGVTANGEISFGNVVATGNSVVNANSGVNITYSNINGQASASVTLGKTDILRNDFSKLSQYGVYSSTQTNHSSASANMVVGKATISENSIAAASGILNDSAGIELADYFQSTVSDSEPVINGNNISDFHSGLSVRNYSRASISCNTFARNRDSGILVTSSGSMTAANNTIVDNGLGLKINGSSTVNAEMNWWGSPAGPVACTSCNTVSAGGGTIDFKPWLTAQTNCSPAVSEALFSWTLFMPAFSASSARR